MSLKSSRDLSIKPSCPDKSSLLIYTMKARHLLSLKQTLRFCGFRRNYHPLCIFGNNSKNHLVGSESYILHQNTDPCLPFIPALVLFCQLQWHKRNHNAILIQCYFIAFGTSCCKATVTVCKHCLQVASN